MRETQHFATNCLVAATAFGLGAAFMYYYDPVSGRRRRAITREKTVSAANEAIESAESTARDLRNRGQGVLAEVKSAVTPEK
jgi:Flp pilus assembly protein TadB